MPFFPAAAAMRVLDPAQRQTVSTAFQPLTAASGVATVRTVTAAPPAPVLPLNSSARSRAATMDELNRLYSCATCGMTLVGASLLLCISHGAALIGSFKQVASNVTTTERQCLYLVVVMEEVAMAPQSMEPHIAAAAEDAGHAVVDVR